MFHVVEKIQKNLELEKYPIKLRFPIIYIYIDNKDSRYFVPTLYLYKYIHIIYIYIYHCC